MYVAGNPNLEPVFEKFQKQRQAIDLLNRHDHTLLVGGSRSAKTATIVRNIIIRALKRPSRHLIARLRFNHAKQSILYDTFPKIMRLQFPQVSYEINKQDWFVTFNGGTPKESQIWFGGVDSKERTEKILGNEYSTIFLNECSQIDYDATTTLRTRLAESSGLKLKMYYDMNPLGKNHWTYQEFVERVYPGTKKGHSLDVAHLFMNPRDNPYIPDEYKKALKKLPTQKRKRFWKGEWLVDIEGALWTEEMVSWATVKEPGELNRIVVAVDPSVTNNPGSNECGIIVCGRDKEGDGVVIDDLTGKYSTKQWAEKAVKAYHDHNANAIVIETNQGGDLVEDALKNIDRSVKVIKVRASHGKKARAEPISELYELKKVSHLKDFALLESELTEWVPEESTYSPNRLDALVWGFSHLMLKHTGGRPKVGAV